MIGNSLRSDIEPVIELGGWGIHMPYHITWAHEAQHTLAEQATGCSRSSRRLSCRCAGKPQSLVSG